MSENKKLIPKRRFKEFQNTDAWEQRELGTIMNLRKETGEPGQYTVDIELENLVTDMGQIVGDTSVRTQTNSVFRRGDTLFGRLRPYLNKWWLSDTDGVKSGEIWAFYPSEKNVEKFIYVLVQGKNFLDSANQSTGTKMPRADWNKVSTADVFIPDFKEQEKIGTFFSTLDQTIAFQQRKLEKMKSMKSAYLSEMFPAEGERKPKRRFPGFTDDWEPRELGEVADIIGGGTPSTSVKEFWGGNIDWYSPVEIGDKVFVNGSQKKITDLGFQKSSAQMLPAGTVLFTSRAGIGSTAILETEACTNQGFQSIVPKENLDTYFIYSRSHELKRYGEITGAGSTFVEVSGKQMAKMPILIPDIEEQREIGNFFQNLDQTIAFQQQKLEKLQNIKKAYLNEMFI
ncbi:restriction endonuclease subunit S [Lactococcus lactis]|uniref:restriction endonuclease subunit S n=1 Tax=Lactococcus lactis TaxID=1358 RepID=UPI003D0E6A64